MRIPARFVIAAAAFAIAASVCVSAAAKVAKEDQKKYDLAFQSVVAHFEKFKVFLEDDKTKESLKELQAIVAIDFPDGSEGSDGVMLQVEAHTYLGEMLTEAGDFDGAVKTLQEGIKKAPAVDPATYDLYMALGHAYKKLKKSDEALAAFDKAEKINKALKDKESKSKDK